MQGERDERMRRFYIHRLVPDDAMIVNFGLRASWKVHMQKPIKDSARARVGRARFVSLEQCGGEVAPSMLLALAMIPAALIMFAY